MKKRHRSFAIRHDIRFLPATYSCRHYGHRYAITDVAMLYYHFHYAITLVIVTPLRQLVDYIAIEYLLHITPFAAIAATLRLILSSLISPLSPLP